MPRRASVRLADPRRMCRIHAAGLATTSCWAASRLGVSRAGTGYLLFVVLIGLLLIGVAAGFTVDVFLQNSQDVDVDVLGRTFTVGPGWIVIAGIIALATFAIGARLVARGTRRARRRRSALRAAESAARERDQLTQQLAAQRERKDEDAATVDPSQYQAGVPTSTD